MKTRLQDRFTRVDAVALLAFAAVWIYYAFVVRYGFCFPDEGFYLSIAERVVHGDRPLVDEWHLSQLSSLILCLPYRFYAALKGSTDGIILFMRYLFLIFNAVFYWCMYTRLRAYRWAALAATLLFCVYVPGTIYACNYYTFSTRLLMLACLLLFSEKSKKRNLILAGVLLSASVVSQVGFAFLYFLYTALVWFRFLRQKKGKHFLDDYAFCVNTRTWMYLSVGVFACAAIFSIWLLTRSGLRNILTSLPYMLLTDPEYDFSANGGARIIFFKKLANAVKEFGLVCVIPAVFLIALSICYARGMFRTRRVLLKKILFCSACVLWVLSCILPFRSSGTSSSDILISIYPIPLSWFGLVCYLLCEHRNKRLFLFWIVGLCASLSIDFFSDVMLSLGCPLSFITVTTAFADLVQELSTESREKKISGTDLIRSRKTMNRFRIAVRWCARLTGAWFALWFAFVLLVMENPIIPAENITGTPFSSMTYRCEKGPLQSLRCGETYAEVYNGKLADMDTLKAKQPKNLYVCGLSPELYLYAGLPYSTSSSYAWSDETYIDRHVQYWKQHPDRLPECIYFPVDPYYNKSNDAQLLGFIRQSFDPLCRYTLEKGKSGFILYASQWYADPAQ